MQVSEGTALVTLCWIVLANNIVLGVIDILLLVVIPVFEVVFRGGEDNSCRYLPLLVSPGNS